MESKNTFVKQAAILAAAGLISRIIGFLYRLPLTELFLGDEGNGIASPAYNLYNFFLIISSAGLPAAISKMVSQRLALGQYRNAHEIFKSALIVSSCVGLACSLVLGLFARQLSVIFGWQDSYYSILALSPTIFIVAIMAVFRGYFQGMNTTIPTAASQLLEQIFNAFFSVFLAYLMLKNNMGLAMAAAGSNAGTGIGALAGLLLILFIYSMAAPSLKRRVRRDKHSGIYESRRSLAFELIGTAIPIIAGTAIFSITNIIDASMASSRLTASNAFTSDRAKALYGQLSGKYTTLTTLPASISTSIATALIPSIAYSLALRDNKAVNHKINMALRLSMFISTPAAMGLGLFSNQIISMLFPSHREGGDLLLIGAVSVLFLAVVQVSTGILQSINKLYIPVIAAACGALVKIPLNYVLIANPDINIKGAVISTVACYVVAAFIDLFFLIKFTGIRLDVKGIFLKPIFATTVMGLSCYVIYYIVYYAVPSNTLALCIAIISGVCVYGIFMLLIGGFQKSEINMMPVVKKLLPLLESHGMV